MSCATTFVEQLAELMEQHGVTLRCEADWDDFDWSEEGCGNPLLSIVVEVEGRSEFFLPISGAFTPNDVRSATR